MKTLAFLISLLAVSFCQAQPPEVTERFKARVFEGEMGVTIPYRILSPADIEEGQTYPLVLFLHGAGERGDNNVAQLVHGMNDLCTDEMMARYPAFVVAPQCPEEQRWCDVEWSSDAHTLPEEPSGSMTATMMLLETLVDEQPIDTNRLYVTGLSMGGYGTWDAIARYPGTFAAAVPICGGGDPAQASIIRETPIWAFHGDLDEAVPVNRSREMIEALREQGASPIYTEYEGVGHNSWTETYRNRVVWDWLFSQRLPGE